MPSGHRAPPRLAMRTHLLRWGRLWLVSWVALHWAALLAHRLGFALAFVEVPPGAPGQPTLWQQFVLGLRFDLATLPVLVLPALIAYNALPFYAQAGRVSRWILRIVASCAFAVFAWAQITLLAGSVSFGYNEKLPGWEYYAYLSDLPTLAGGALQREPWTILLAVTLLAVCGLTCYRLVWSPKSRFARLAVLLDRTKHYQRAGFGLYSPGRPVGFLRLALSVVLFFGLLRGGWQQNPLRAPDAMRSTDPALNYAALNTVYTILQELTDRSEFQTFFDAQENRRFMQSLLHQHGRPTLAVRAATVGQTETGKPKSPDNNPRPPEFVSDEYPLVRKMEPTSHYGLRRPNIVLVIMESFTAAYLQPYGGEPGIAPHFNRLAGNGLLFRNFFSGGGRSANGLFSMLAGIPDRSGRTILRSPQILVRQGGLAALLRQKGYQTFFYHGGDLRFDNLDRFLPAVGFQKQVGSSELERSGCCHKKNAWGYDDRETFTQFLSAMDRSQKPFFGVVFSLNTHHPFAIPAGAPRPFTKRQQGEFLNAYHYSDSVLGHFMAEMSRRPYFNNTVFLITGDHAHHTGLDYLDDRMVPLLVYSPGRIPAGVRHDIASQLDILPTTLALSGGDSLYASTGRDLLNVPHGPTFAFFAGGSGTNVIGWIQNDRIFSEWLRGDLHGMFSIVRPLQAIDLKRTEPELVQRLRRRTLHLHQFVRTLESENRIWPPPEWFARHRSQTQ